MQQVANFVDGKRVMAAATLTKVDPATGRESARVSDSSAAEVDAAVRAARRAFAGWSATPAAERSRVLMRLADLIDANLESLAAAESADTGKPLWLARSLDIPRSAANFRFFAGAILHTSGEMYQTDAPPPSQAVGAGVGAGAGAALRAINYTLRSPRGVAGLISPWNLPLYLLSWKIAPALATGNTAVCKPSEVTPTTATMLAELGMEAGLPAGVLNIVHGSGATAGAALVEHPEVPAISFTGSTAVGKWIGARAGGMLKRVSLELGGKNPFVIFPDAAMTEAVEVACRAAFANQGQVCLCGSRLLVHRSCFEHVKSAVVRHAESLRVGDPMDGGSQQGALVSRAHLEKVHGLVQKARELGATLHCGGAPVPPERLPERCKGGFFYAPTVLSGLDPMCSVEQEEIFGPVVSLQAFESEDEAVALANSTKYGLAASVFTADLSRAHRVAERLEAGIVWVNCWMLRDLRTPFGGAKQSGVGREGGSEALRFFTEPKNVCVRV